MNSIIQKLLAYVLHANGYVYNQAFGFDFVTTSGGGEASPLVEISFRYKDEPDALKARLVRLPVFPLDEKLIPLSERRK